MMIGLVGKPSVGKSTFFKAATLAEVEIAPYPFTTLKPNEGVAFVRIKCPEKDFSLKCHPRFGFCLGGERFVPVKLIDIPGLVPGAHLGKGLGNQFLETIRQADAVLLLIDLSGTTDEKGNQTENYSPLRDIEFLEEELNMWYYQVLTKGFEKLIRQGKAEKVSFGQILEKQFSAFNLKRELIEKTVKELHLDEDFLQWKEGDLLLLAKKLREKTKPFLIVGNKLDSPSAEKNLEALKNYFLIPCSAEIELALREAARKGIIEYLPNDSFFKIKPSQELDEKKTKALEFIENFLRRFKSTGVQEAINKVVFDLLKYIVAFPVANSRLTDSEGNVLPDCFLMPEGSTALDLAYRIHTTIGANFIKAIDLRTKKILGKDYKLKNNDVIEIVDKK